VAVIVLLATWPQTQRGYIPPSELQDLWEHR
jgi:hypothetical protein